MEKKDDKEMDLRDEHKQEDVTEEDVDETKSKTSRLQVMFSLSRVGLIVNFFFNLYIVYMSWLPNLELVAQIPAITWFVYYL